MQVTIRHLFVSPGHNFFGRLGQAAGEHETIEVETVKCRAGWGIEGDRFYGYRPDYNGQITFFDWADYVGAMEKFSVPTLSAGAFRRNAVIEGLDLNAMIGREFTIGSVAFLGMAEARPCFWMNGAVAPGAEEWLKGRGGLRARILISGELKKGPAELSLGAGQLELVEKTAGVPKPPGL